MIITHTDYAVKTKLGASIHTFNDRKKAIAFAEANAGAFPGCYVERVEYVAPVRTKIWRDRSHLRLVEAVA